MVGRARERETSLPGTCLEPLRFSGFFVGAIGFEPLRATIDKQAMLLAFPSYGFDSAPKSGRDRFSTNPHPSTRINPSWRDFGDRFGAFNMVRREESPSRAAEVWSVGALGSRMAILELSSASGRPSTDR